MQFEIGDKIHIYTDPHPDAEGNPRIRTIMTVTSGGGSSITILSDQEHSQGCNLHFEVVEKKEVLLNG